MENVYFTSLVFFLFSTEYTHSDRSDCSEITFGLGKLLRRDVGTKRKKTKFSFSVFLFGTRFSSNCYLFSREILRRVVLLFYTQLYKFWREIVHNGYEKRV